MKHYDPDVLPDAAAWFDLDEQMRIHLVERYHRNSDEEIPNLTGHAAIHVIVENQIAEGLESVVGAMTRLVSQGLSRHDALHAIGSCLSEQLFEALNNEDEGHASALDARYNAALERLTAQEWKRKYG